MVSRPHGGKLVNRTLPKNKVEELVSSNLNSIDIPFNDFLELRNIAQGVFSPLKGFMTSTDFNSVNSNYRLSNGLAWTIPIVLDTSKEESKNYKEGEEIILNYNNNPVGVLHLEDKYSVNLKDWALSVYGTIDKAHPGVNGVNNRNKVLLGGNVEYFNNMPTDKYRLSPADARELFREHGWRSVAAFQTRNAPHTAHEFLQKTALEVVDGLLIHPLIGRKKPGDFKNEVIVNAYDVLVKNYYPTNSMVFGTLTTRMHYAGPIEAIHHAIMRKNHGCTHFIVGRDHAGVGDYYGTFAAQEIFGDFPDLGIQPLLFENSFYCKKCTSVRTIKTCPHQREHHMNFSGTKIRKMINEKTPVPTEMMRPEIYDFLTSQKELYVK